MLTQRFWVDAAERAVRGALVVFLTILTVDGAWDENVDWKAKLVGAALGAAYSLALSLLSALRDDQNASLVLKDNPDEPPARPL